MKPETKRLIAFAVGGDDTLTDTEKDALASIMGEGTTNRILTRAEAAAVLHRTPKTLDQWARSGILKKFAYPGIGRAAGFREADIRALMSSPA